MPEVASPPSLIEPALAEEGNTVPFATDIGVVLPESLEGGTKFIPSASDTEGYEIARLRFFRDLFEGERLRILVELGALSESFNERINQGIERKLLDLLVREGKLEGIEKMIDQLIGEREEEAK
ncbi:hypothetical protein [Yersinia similis]|uniref:hypothetical protein n=1 Tax=Yersinia similis TaxID=367190 RepID=UPI001C6FCA8E